MKFFSFCVLTHSKILKDSFPAAQPPLKQNMNTIMKAKADAVVAHDALFKVSITQAKHAGLDEIRISVPRARVILNDLIALKKAVESPYRNIKQPAHFDRLDSMFFKQAEAINEAMTKILQ
jgi:hypothetical protein